MKILMIIERFPPNFSGAANFVIRLSKKLITRGYDITVLTAGMENVPKNEMMDGIRVIRKGGWSRRVNRFFFLLDGLLYLVFTGYKYDIFHIYCDPDIAVFARLIAKMYGKKIIAETSLFGSDDPMSIKKRKSGMIRFPSFLLSDAFVSLSFPIARSFESAKIPPEKVHQIARMADMNTFKPAGEDEKKNIREKLRLPLNAFIIISIGAIEHRKGYDVLIRAFKLAMKKVPNAFLLMLGPYENLTDNGTFYSELLNFAKSNDLLRSVRFVGNVSHVETYLKASDIFVFPSRKEGFATVIIEAMSTGLPCVVSELDGISQNSIFMEKNTGVVIAGEDPADYANAILDFIGDEARMEQYGENARKLVAKKFSSEKITQKYIDMYQGLICTKCQK
jgi:glycosyltransferase involved in cell wall biosynthesis